MIWITHIDILTMGKCYPVSQLRQQDAKIQITHVEHYSKSVTCLPTRTFKQCILTINQYKNNLWIEYSTVDGLNFARYQFSWFSWRAQSTNSSTYEMVMFCMNYERKYYGHEIEPHECVLFVQSTKIKPSTVCKIQFSGEKKPWLTSPCLTDIENISVAFSLILSIVNISKNT